MNGLANALCTTNWKDFGNSDEGRTTDTIFNALCLANQGGDATIDDDIMVEGDEEIEAEIDEDKTDKCVPVSYRKFLNNDRSNRGSFRCQVCLFEGRKTCEIKHVVICSRHAMRLCTTVQKDLKLYKDDDKNQEINDYSWRAPEGLTCWQKAHQFYIPKGLFNNNPTPVPVESPQGKIPRFQKSRVSSDLYTKKRIAFGLMKVVRGRKKTKPRKKPPAGSYVEEIEEIGESQMQQGEDLRQTSHNRQSLSLNEGMCLEERQIEQL